MTTERKSPLNPGKIAKLWPFLVQLHRDNPQVFEDPERLLNQVAVPWPALRDKAKCPNCHASMAEYTRDLDYFAATLLVSLARIVKKRLEEGEPFTEANKVHIAGENGIPFGAKLYGNITSKLGLVVMVKQEGGRFAKKPHWAITKRGWAALRGEPVPKRVRVFRNSIIERTEETTTLAAVFAGSEHTEAGPYDPSEWVRIEGFSAGML